MKEATGSREIWKNASNEEKMEFYKNPGEFVDQVRALEKVPNADHGKSRIEQMNEIVQSRSMMKVDGFMIDLFTANLIVQVYDRLNPMNQKKFCGMSIPKMCEVTFKLLAALKN